MEILPLFCEIDDFCKVFEKLSAGRALTNGKKRNRATSLSLSEVMTISVLYHASGDKNLKAFYLEEILRHHSLEFPWSVQLSTVCPIAIRMRDALVFLSPDQTAAIAPESGLLMQLRSGYVTT